jgi:hypothetical protein
MARKRYGNGTLTDLQRVLWRAIREVEELLDVRPCSTDVILKAAHALAQLAGAYRGVLEVGEIEARLEHLESAASERNGHAQH